jgi:serine/threonine-protein kinase
MSVGSDSARDVSLDDLEGAFSPGSVVAGKYRVERKLGVGGMGVVVAARHLQLNSMVAIKFLHEGGSGGTGTARFLREARAAAALKSEHVARVIDMGTLDDTKAPFMVMEYLEGVSLSKYIRQHAPMPVPEAASLMLQACDALGEAHARGIIHRDVKPSNMFLTKRNDGSTLLKVLDFGISKAPLLSDEAEPTLTQSQMVLGSPQYLSPEQFADVRTVDSRTDIWALGVVLYYMLSGRRPFEEETLGGLCLAIATEQPPRLIDLRPDIPLEVHDVVMRCLEKDRDKRVESAAELASAIAHYASGASRVAVENIGVVAPESSIGPVGPLAAPSSSSSLSLGAVELDHPSAPLARGARELVVRRAEGGANGVLAMQARRRSSLGTWLQVGAAVALVAVLALLFVNRGSSQPERELGGVGPVVAPAGPLAEGASTASTADSQQPRERTVLVPGSANPMAAPKPKPTAEMDLSQFVTANQVGTAQVQLRLLDSAGGQQVVAKVPKGEIVVVKKVVGEWVLVAYTNDNGKVITGWTLRNLVQ